MPGFDGIGANEYIVDVTFPNTVDFISAVEARDLGLYNQVVAADQLAGATAAFAARMAAGPLFALAKTKEMLNRELDMDLETALECEAQAQAICSQHPDFREAYTAFVEKRKPDFA